MILSRYCKIFPHEEQTSSLILFSTKKSSIIQIPKSLLKDIQQGEITDKEKKTLFEFGFLVNDPDEEKKEMLCLMEELNSLNREFKVTLVMNIDCNLACKYCFEGTRKGKYYITGETADRVVEFLKSRTPKRAFEKIHFVFYGGEPLLCIEMIVYISEKLKSHAEGNNMEYSSSLITNGTLLTPRNVERLKKAGLKDASVTIDGPKHIHDLQRPFKSGSGSFDAIIRNLRHASEMIDVQIGGNFTKKSYPAFPGLLDFLIDNGLTPDKIPEIRFESVTQESRGIALPDFHEGITSVNEPWVFKASVFLREEILKRGYKTPRITPISCMMDYKDKMMINYDGDIYKCNSLIGRKKFCVGNIRTGVVDYRKSHNLDNWKNVKCLECCYLPLCFGGCRYMRLVREGDMKGVDCKKPYFDATLEALVKQDIKYKLTG